MTTIFTPPPTYADPVIVDEVTKNARFNPIWLKWFVDMAEVISALPASVGTVTSVAQTVPTEFSVSGSPVTSAGTLAISKVTQTANYVWAGPSGGAPAQPNFRTLVSADMPAGLGTVTSVSVTNANGVSGTVATATTTPAISLTLGAITPTSVNFGGSTLSSYISSSFTGTLTGVTGTVTGTVYYVKIGDQVTIDTPYSAMTGTSNSASKTITGMPATIRPTSNKRWFAMVQDNSGGTVQGEFFLGSSGVLDFYTSLNAAGFTASGTATINQLCYTYTVN